MLNKLQQSCANVIELFGRFNRQGDFARRSAASHDSRRAPGCVYLVGAGCGDPELLTLKAYRLMQSAQVVLYDALIDEAIIDMLPANCAKVFVGKRAGQHSASQPEICRLLLHYARQGNTVLRLKGGDPGIFGRLSEECQTLNNAGIRCAIVPGISAASGCAAYAGIALTDRDCAHSVHFVTAHGQHSAQQPDWRNLAESAATLVFYMGLNRVETIANELQRHGKNSSTAIAIIDQGSKAGQQQCLATLGTIMQHQRWQQFGGPALIIVGAVVAQRHLVDLSLLAPDQANTQHATRAADNLT